jgi:L-rhamnose mutarotase
MKVDPGQEAEYIRRHQPIWPELEAALKAHGVRSYSIFLDRANNELFAYLECDDAAQLEQVGRTTICRKWWDFMAPLMPTHADNRPVIGNLEEVFHIEAEP